MATTLPRPSKRQKTLSTAEANRIPSPPPSPPSGLQRIQFLDADTRTPQGPTVSISLSDLTPSNLSLLLNNLLGHNDITSRLPYRFYNPLGGEGEFSQEAIFRAIQAEKVSTELTLEIPCRAEAVFRVQPVTRCSASISGHGESVLTSAFSPATSTRLATGSGDNMARIWDCETGTPLHTLKGHSGWVLAVAWSPDGGMLATGSMDSSVRLWDPATGQALGGALKGHAKWITSLSWEPYHLRAQGRPRFASASRDFTVRVWDAVSKHTDFALTGHTGCVSCVKWGGKGWVYTASHDRTVKIWDATGTSKGTLIHTFTAHAHWVNHLALSTDFALRTGYHDHKSSKEVPAGVEGKRQKAQDRYNAVLASSPDGSERLVTASDDCTIYLWSPSTTTKPLHRLHGHQKQVNHVVFSPTGHLIASAGFDNHVKLWSAASGAFLHTLRGHVGPVYQVAFSADGRLLVSASKDTTLKVWDTRTGKLGEDLPGHKDEVFTVDWSPDGDRVGSGGQDKAVRIWRN